MASPWRWLLAESKGLAGFLRCERRWRSGGSVRRRLLDRADLDADEIGVDEELERVELLTW
jgi:hypothetical protein